VVLVAPENNYISHYLVKKFQSIISSQGDIMINYTFNHQIFSNNIRIIALSAMDKDAIWVHNIHTCITKFPIKKKDGYSLSFVDRFAKQLHIHMAQNGHIFLICYAPSEDKKRPFEIASIMEKNGFKHIDNILIVKNWSAGKRFENSLMNTHEYILWFTNGDKVIIDKEPVNNFLKLEEGLAAGNTWHSKVSTLDEAIPQDISDALIKMTNCLPSSLIFDPFMGNSSTITSALNCGHNFYGFETNEKKIKKYTEILDNYHTEDIEE
jgi:DNA modification methylase